MSPINQYNIKHLAKCTLDEYICQICNRIYPNKEYSQCKNGHIAHKDCWENQSNCYDCKIDIKPSELSKCLLIEKQISKIEVSCPFSFNNILNVDDSEPLERDYENGCNKTTTIGNLNNHIETCGHRFKECENQLNGCLESIRYNQYAQHLEECLYQKVNCEDCHSTHILNEADQHFNVCPSKYISCHQCNEEVQRGSMVNHLDNTCNETTISCAYSEFGCSETFKRVNLNQHYKDINHVVILGDAIKELKQQNKDLQSKYENKQRDHDQLTQRFNELHIRLRDSFSNLNSNEYKNTWTINEYTTKCNGYTLFSPVFKHGLFSFNIKLHKNDKDGSPALYLYYKEDYPINIKLTMTLLNHKNNNKNHKNEFEKDYNEDFIKDSSLLGYGWPKFIQGNQITKDNGFLSDNDKITFEFTLSLSNTKSIKPLSS